MHKHIITAAIVLAASAVCDRARADVAYSVAGFFFAEDGPPSYQIEVRMTADREESVLIPLGTILTADDKRLQHLLLGEEIRADLHEGETRVVIAPAYCMQETRRGPGELRTLSEAGVARDPRVLALLSADIGRGERQRRVWEYLTPRRLRSIRSAGVARPSALTASIFR